MALRIALAQLDLLVGDVDGNTARVLDVARQAHAAGASVLLAPELALAGYPPEDLLFHSGFRRQVEQALVRLCQEAPPLDLIAGYPEYEGKVIYNAAALVRGGRVYANHRKQLLPNYRVFDEKRYFRAGGAPTLVDIGGLRAALLVCEDLWEPEPLRQARAAGAELVLALNASPFELGKQAQREATVRERVLATGVPVVYVNLVGGQDELVFDGQSFAMNADGTLAFRAPAWQEGLHYVEVERGPQGVRILPGTVTAAAATVEETVYGALVTGVRDYVEKHRFPGVVLGLSGGIDSALTLAIAADALGADRVHAVLMPSRYTSQMSIDDAVAQAEAMGVKHSLLSIEPMFDAALATLADEFAGRPVDTAEENIQSRVRGLLLMALSNKTGRMLLTTGNKSEMAVGYATLYGDMNGGFAPIKDLSKMLVYRVANWRNVQLWPGARNSTLPVIPQRVIDRPPSAELRPDQKDSDSLPDYAVLDAILEAFIEEDLSVDEIVARGFDRATVGRVLAMVKRNEYKRRQAPPGVRISRRAFGRDWRYPITSGYHTR
jgi:NAD+ synthase (glutamine-hydrolysing)